MATECRPGLAGMFAPLVTAPMDVVAPREPHDPPMPHGSPHGFSRDLSHGFSHDSSHDWAAEASAERLRDIASSWAAEHRSRRPEQLRCASRLPRGDEDGDVYL